MNIKNFEFKETFKIIVLDSLCLSNLNIDFLTTIIMHY